MRSGVGGGTGRVNKKACFNIRIVIACQGDDKGSRLSMLIWNHILTRITARIFECILIRDIRDSREVE
jgi:hypothetical protein